MVGKLITALLSATALTACVFTATAEAAGPVPKVPYVSPAKGPVVGNVAPQQVASRQASAASLLDDMKETLAFVSVRASKLPPATRKRAAPYFKALIETTRALDAMKAATKSRNSARLSKAISTFSVAIGKLNTAYGLSGLRDARIKSGMASFNKAAPLYLQQVGKSRKASSPETRKANYRRATALSNRVRVMETRQGITAAEQRRLRALQASIDRALVYYASPDFYWYGDYIVADCWGQYQGYYEYYTVYEPSVSIYYYEEIGYWNTVYSSVEVNYVQTYEDYSWSRYEESISISVEMSITLTDTEVVEVRQAEQRLEEKATALIVETGEAEKLQKVETAALPVDTALPDPGEQADPKVDAAFEEAPPVNEADVATPLESATFAPEEPAAPQPEAEQPKAEQPQTDPTPQPETQQPQTEQPQTDPAPQPETQQPQTEQPQVEPEPQPEPAPQVEPEPQPEPAPQAEPEPQPEPAPQAEPEPQPEPEPQAEPEPQPEPEPQAEPEPQPEPEPQAEPEPQPEPEPMPEPEPEPEPEAPACEDPENCPQ